MSTIFKLSDQEEKVEKALERGEYERASFLRETKKILKKGGNELSRAGEIKKI